MEGREREVVQEDAGALQLLGEEVGYLVVLGVVIWEVDHVVEGLVEGQEGGLVEDQVVDLVEAQEAEAEALEPSFLQACQEASRTEEHLVGGQEVGQMVDQEASLVVPEVDQVVEVLSSVALACVEALAVPWSQLEGAVADWP